jgi:hypothetical protein
MTTNEDVAAMFVHESSQELNAAAGMIQHCLEQLSDQQLWWRPHPKMNSAANLVLHLCGNLRQWVISGIGGAEDARDRPREFSERGPLSKSELLRRLEDTVNEAQQVLQAASVDQLGRPRRIQGFDVTGLGAAVHAVSHFRGHTQEIVHLTRCQLAEAYRFHFVPATPEQGA